MGIVGAPRILAVGVCNALSTLRTSTQRTKARNGGAAHAPLCGGAEPAGFVVAWARSAVFYNCRDDHMARGAVPTQEHAWAAMLVEGWLRGVSGALSKARARRSY